MDEDQRRTVIVLAAVGLLVAAGLAVLSFQAREGPRDAARVAVRVDDAEGRPLHEGSVHLPADGNDVLTALRTLAQSRGFTVDTDEFPGLGSMVVEIAGIRNQGSCGWVYEVNGAGGDKAADFWRLSDGDSVRWFWTCHTA